MNKQLMMMVVLWCAGTAAYAAEVYKWKDAEGHIHYGDKPVDGAAKVEVKAPPSQLQLQKERDNALATGEKTKKQYEECKTSKEQLMTYQNASSVIRKDGLGGEKELDANERAKLIQITQQRVKDSCSALTPE
jgi:hypothetical protein